MDELSPDELREFLGELSTNHGADGLWAALEIVSMYRHGMGKMDVRLARIVQPMLLSPALTLKVRNAARDGHVFESLFIGVQEAVETADELVTGFCAQVEKLCQSERYSVFSDLDDPFQRIMSRLVGMRPTLIWANVAAIYEKATSIERNRLLRLVGPQERDDERKYLSPGILFGVPEQDILAWADEAPIRRAPFLTSIYPILQPQGDHFTWHDSIDALAMRYGKHREFLQSISNRIYPDSWSGSIIPLLSVWLEPLETWSTHKIQAVAVWAREQRRALTSQIQQEKAWENDR